MVGVSVLLFLPSVINPLMTLPDAGGWKVGDIIKTGTRADPIIKIGLTEKSNCQDKAKWVAMIRCNDCNTMIEFDLDKMTDSKEHKDWRLGKLNDHYKTKRHKDAIAGVETPGQESVIGGTKVETQTETFPFFGEYRLPADVPPEMISSVLKEITLVATKQIERFLSQPIADTCIVVMEPSETHTAFRLHFPDLPVNKDMANQMRTSLIYTFANHNWRGAFVDASSNPKAWENAMLGYRVHKLPPAQLHSVVVGGQIDEVFMNQLTGSQELLYKFTTVRCKEGTEPCPEWKCYSGCPSDKQKLFQPPSNTKKQENLDITHFQGCESTARNIVSRISPMYKNAILRVVRRSKQGDCLKVWIIMGGEGSTHCVHLEKEMKSAKDGKRAHLVELIQGYMDNDIHTPYVEVSNEGKAKLMCARCDYLCTKVEHCKRLPIGEPPMTYDEKRNRQVSLNERSNLLMAPPGDKPQARLVRLESEQKLLLWYDGLRKGTAPSNELPSVLMVPEKGEKRKRDEGDISDLATTSHSTGLE